VQFELFFYIINKTTNNKNKGILMLLTKRGAMFGLDARIALAIFGALSVISGAALYSAIQDSKITALITQLEELSKSYEHYYLENGSHTPRYGLFNIEAKPILENVNSLSTWNGPYFSGGRAVSSADDSGHKAMIRDLRVKDDAVYFKIADPEATWIVPEDITAGCSSNCYIWIELSKVGDLNKQLDIEIDGADTRDAGDIRVYSTKVYYNTKIPYKV
jgi:type II secretory pathway pseudopilin PulG